MKVKTMKNSRFNMIKTLALTMIVAYTLTACGGGSSNDPEPTPTNPTTPSPSPSPSPSPAPSPAPKRVSKVPEIYYFDDAGQWRLMPGVTPQQAYEAGVLCKIPPTQATIDAYLANGRTLEWIMANIYRFDLCPGY